ERGVTGVVAGVDAAAGEKARRDRGPQRLDDGRIGLRLRDGVLVDVRRLHRGGGHEEDRADEGCEQHDQGQATGGNKPFPIPAPPVSAYGLIHLIPPSLWNIGVRRHLSGSERPPAKRQAKSWSFRLIRRLKARSTPDSWSCSAAGGGPIGDAAAGAGSGAGAAGISSSRESTGAIHPAAHSL